MNKYEYFKCFGTPRSIKNGLNPFKSFDIQNISLFNRPFLVGCLCWILFCLAVINATAKKPHSSSLKELSLQALIHQGGATFIDWSLRRLFRE